MQMKSPSMQLHEGMALADEWRAGPLRVGASIQRHRVALGAARNERILRHLWTTLMEVAPLEERETLGFAFLDAAYKNDKERLAANLLTGYNIDPHSHLGMEHAKATWPIVREWIQAGGGDMALLGRAVGEHAMLLATGKFEEQSILTDALVDTHNTPLRVGQDPWIHLWMERCVANCMPQGSRAALRTLLRAGVDLDAPNGRQMTALEALALRLNIDHFKPALMGLLLDGGARHDLPLHPTARAIVDLHPFVRREQLAVLADERPTTKPKGRL